MGASWLFENFNGNLFFSDIFESVDREYGVPFVPEVDSRIVGMRWWRASGTPAQKPTILRVWAQSTGTVLYTLGTIPDNGAIGWQAAAVPEVPTVLGGSIYIASFAWQTNRQKTAYNFGQVPPPNWPARFYLPPKLFSASGSIGMPVSQDNGGTYGIDVRLRAQARPVTYTSAGSVAFDTETVWATPANVYRLTLTTIPQWSTRDTVAGVDATRVAGFWQPILNGAYGQNGRIDNASSNLFLPGKQLMDGVLIKCYPGTLGTLEAFLVDDAT